jgi:hypothetical protein
MTQPRFTLTVDPKGSAPDATLPTPKASCSDPSAQPHRRDQHASTTIPTSPRPRNGSDTPDIRIFDRRKLSPSVSKIS